MSTRALPGTSSSTRTPAREHMLWRLAAAGVRRVPVEARPELVRRNQVAQACTWLGAGASLEVGIGLESADDHVREVLIRKGFGRADFERAVGEVAAASARLLVYPLVKPMGLSEAEAVEDPVASAAYVFQVAQQHGVPARVALQPTFVPPGTALEADYLAGRYTPPSL